MNEYIVQIISATRLWLISRYSHHTEKAQKNDRQKRTSMYRVIFVTLLTNKSPAHGEPITVLYAKNTFLYGKYNSNTHDSCIFDQLITNVCPVCTSDVLQTQTENFEQPKNDSIALESPFDIVVISDVPTRYLIFCTKQTRKQSLFYRQHPERHVTFPECIHFPGRMACLC